MLKQYSYVVAKNNNYFDEYGVKAGDIGCILEIWDSDYVEVAFSYSNGVDYAQAAMNIKDLENADIINIKLPTDPAQST